MVYEVGHRSLRDIGVPGQAGSAGRGRNAAELVVCGLRRGGIGMSNCMRLMLSLVVGLVWIAAAAADEPDMFGFLTQASYWDQAAPQGEGNPAPYGEAHPMPGYGPGWEQQALSGQEGWPGCGRASCRPALTVSADLVVMERVGGRPSTLISNSTSGAPLLNVTDLNFSFAPGPRLDFIYHGNCGWDGGP